MGEPTGQGPDRLHLLRPVQLALASLDLGAQLALEAEHRDAAQGKRRGEHGGGAGKEHHRHVREIIAKHHRDERGQRERDRWQDRVEHRRRRDRPPGAGGLGRPPILSCCPDRDREAGEP